MRVTAVAYFHAAREYTRYGLRDRLSHDVTATIRSGLRVIQHVPTRLRGWDTFAQPLHDSGTGNRYTKIEGLVNQLADTVLQTAFNMSFAKLVDTWRGEEEQLFSGWDFSWLDGRMFEEQAPSSYSSRAAELLRRCSSVIDLGTGGGERFWTYRNPGLKWLWQRRNMLPT